MLVLENDPMQPPLVPDSDTDPEEWAGRVDGFSLHAGVAAKAHERKKLERLCR